MKASEAALLLSAARSSKLTPSLREEVEARLHRACGAWAVSENSLSSALDAWNSYSSLRDGSAAEPGDFLARALQKSQRIPLHCLSRAPSTATRSSHQARRDIERDSVLVNGVLLSGSKLGYDGVVSAIALAIANAEADAKLSAVESPEATVRLHALAASLLLVANRTASGGDAFEAASEMLAGKADGAFARSLRAAAGMDCDSVLAAPPPPLTLVPDSASAPPLEVDIDAGAFELAPSEFQAGASPAPRLLGLRAAVRGTTVFRVLRADSDLAAAMLALGAGASPAQAARHGYLGRLTCQYVRTVAALPACVALAPAVAANAAAAAAVGPPGATSVPPALAIAARELVRAEMLRGRPATDDELASIMSAAAAAAKQQAAAAASQVHGPVDDSANRSVLSLPPRARQLFDAGDEGAVLLTYERA